MDSSTSRREFLKASAAVGLGAILATDRVARAADDAAAPAPAGAAPHLPTDKLNVACIGVGGKGSSDVDHVGMYANVVALCDIDDTMIDKKAKKFPQARRYNDFRKMLQEMGGGIDAVTVSTPDNTHAVAAMAAMKLGKHVYCQKPLTKTIAEARALREAAKKYNVVTQMGNQGTADDEFRRGVDILRAEMLGPVKEVHVWTNRPIWPQAPQVTTRPSQEVAVPPTIHWDEWIGPAPMRPYSPAYHPFKWRGWWDFGTGALGDMGCHTANLPFMGLELGYPTSLEGKAGDLNDETYPSWATVVFEFPARGGKPPVKLTWWEGHKPGPKKGDKPVRNLPDKRVTQGFELPDSGSLVVGEKATMISMNDYGGSLKLIFGPNSDGFSGKIPQVLPRIGGGDDKHKLEWLDAIRGGSQPVANFEYAGMLTEFILLGNVAIRSGGKKLEWDGPGMKITNDAEANALVSREFRAGWSL